MIEATQQGDVAILKMVHGKANALDLELLRRDRAVQTDRGVAGARHCHHRAGAIFSAGVDLPRLTAGGVEYVKRFLPALHQLYETVFFHPKPVVAAINGHAIAGGCVLECCADRRIAARAAGASASPSFWLACRSRQWRSR